MQSTSEEIDHVEKATGLAIGHVTGGPSI